MKLLHATSWDPYTSGIYLAAILCSMFLFSNRRLETFSIYTACGELLSSIFKHEEHINNEQKYEARQNNIWLLFFIAGIILGGFISAGLSGNLSLNIAPKEWIEQTPAPVLLRYMTTFTGGIFMGIGAKWAKGCITDHGLGGTMQMSVGSWLAMIFMLVSAIATANLIF